MKKSIPVFKNFNKEVFICSLLLLVMYTVICYISAVMTDGSPSKFVVLNFMAKSFGFFIGYPFLIPFIPFEGFSFIETAARSLIDLLVWAFLIERIDYLIILNVSSF